MKEQKLDLRDLVGQTLCYDIYDKDDPQEVEKIISKIKPGGIFVTDMTKEKIRFYEEMANKYCKVPVLVSSDAENGPFTPVKGAGMLPHPMAWGACNDEALIERSGELTAKICREVGVRFVFAPCVDILYNFQCPSMNIRAVSDSPAAVIRIAGAYMQGLQKGGVVSACKHFPGDGIDDRNPHFLTTINSFSKEKWSETFGKVYREMFRKGCEAIMPGHISLPCVEQGISANECPPACLSYNVLTKLLREELGFDGCIVSDAMSMLGACTACDLNRLAVEFLKAGGDFVLFPEPDDFENILSAVQNGILSEKRLQNAVDHIMRIKEKAGLFCATEIKTCESNLNDEFEKVSNEIAEKSITLVRDYDKLLPISPEKNGKLLVVNIMEPFFKKDPSGNELKAFEDELKKEGYDVTSLYNPKHKYVNNIIDNFDFVLVNIKMSSQDYHGGTMRMGWNTVMSLWRGYIFKNHNAVITSFGDPFKLYDMPYARCYVNAYSFSPASQKAAAKAITGKIKFCGKNPVSFKDYFNREI